jgi:hypothetical protein
VALSEYAPQIRRKVAVRQSAPCLILEMSRVQNWAQEPALMSEVLVSFRHAQRNEDLDDTSHSANPCPSLSHPRFTNLLFADNSWDRPTSGVEVKNEWSYTSTSICILSYLGQGQLDLYGAVLGCV